MTTLHFEWDEPKAEANVKKRRVSFDEAKTVFYDERSCTNAQVNRPGI
ncbi:BrnT family toxin [Propionivibrio sp.]|nr:BrnT family toxin [Propionivibrio sp.]